MGYKIQYGPPLDAEKKIVSIWKGGNKKAIIAILLLVVSLCISYVIGLDTLQEFIFPGDAALTRAAFAEFADNLQNGENFTDAITAFCLEIIENADIQ